jgi:hypothetical protein
MNISRNKLKQIVQEELEAFHGSQLNEEKPCGGECGGNEGMSCSVTTGSTGTINGSWSCADCGCIGPNGNCLYGDCMTVPGGTGGPGLSPADDFAIGMDNAAGNVGGPYNKPFDVDDLPRRR